MTRHHAVARIREEIESFDFWLGIDAILENAENGADLTVAYQEGGAVAAHYIINRAWSADRIRSIIHSFTHGEAPIFWIDKRILPLKTPGETTSEPLEDWLELLHIFTDGHIFVYDPDNSYALTMHHYERIQHNRIRLHISDPLSMGDMQPGMLTTRNDLLNGEVAVTRSYMFTHFGQLKFWKRRAEEAAKAKKKAQDEAKKNRGRASGTQDWDEFYQRTQQGGGFWGNFDSFDAWFNHHYANAYRQHSGNVPGTGSRLDKYYALLEVSPSASNDEVKRAYRKLMMKWHPDKHTANKDAATEKSKEINEAYAKVKAERKLK